jgi:hypothetical protein
VTAHKTEAAIDDFSLTLPFTLYFIGKEIEKKKFIEEVHDISMKSNRW